MRGNGKIIQELEAIFRGAGWNVIKVIWGSDWDSLIQNDRDGLLVKRMGEITDGQYQKYFVESGAYFRQNFFGTDPRLLKMVEHLSDEQLATHAAGRPRSDQGARRLQSRGRAQGRARRVILAKTIKGYGLGEAGEGKNITHQQKKLNEDELRMFRSRFGIPIPDEELHDAPFYRPADDSPEIRYLQERRKQLGGYLPERKVRSKPIAPVSEAHFEEFYKGTDGREVSTTMVFVRLLAKLLRDPEIGKLIVPIIPDEARTFGMEALFRQVGIYSSVGQLYEPVDMDTLLYYKEAKDGQILEEGITEAGSMCSFIAAGTAYANHGINTIPFFIYYSMFGFQRIGDLIWAAADMRTPRLPDRRHRRPHHARGRRPAASGRSQPRAGSAGSQPAGLRSRVRLRNRRHHSGRHQAHVRGSGIHLLLPDRHQRALAHAGDAGRARMFARAF